MARIAGVELPKEKRVEIGLTYIYGIGLKRSQKILAEAGINPDTRVKDLTDDQEQAIRKAMSGYTVEGDLRRDVALNIKQLVEMGCYRGTRHRKNEYPKIRRGAALIAQKSRKNIVMLNIETDFDFLQIHQPIYDAGTKAVVYNLEYLNEIDINKFLEKFPDEVTFKTEITKQISATLYKIHN